MIDALAKVVDIMVRARLEEKIEEDGVLANTQLGFRKGYSTVEVVRD